MKRKRRLRAAFLWSCHVILLLLVLPATGESKASQTQSKQTKAQGFGNGGDWAIAAEPIEINIHGVSVRGAVTGNGF